jgi:dTDP-4-dehydrorhamnose 3,5-epimerase
MMKMIATPLPGVLVVEPSVFGDDRGFFFEAWNSQEFSTAVGQQVSFAQDNHSRSTMGVVRGLHYQLPRPQGKLVRCSLGAVWDVAVDLRKSSPTFGEWFGTELSEENKRQLWIPEGFGHGFVALSDTADLLYKATDCYVAEADKALAWNDPDIGIDWPLESEPVLSAKDATAPYLADAEMYD